MNKEDLLKLLLSYIKEGKDYEVWLGHPVFPEYIIAMEEADLLTASELLLKVAMLPSNNTVVFRSKDRTNFVVTGSTIKKYGHRIKDRYIILSTSFAR